MRKYLILTLTLLAVAAVNAAPKEVFLARNPRVNGGVQSVEQLRVHLASPAGQNDMELFGRRLRLNPTQIEAMKADAVRRSRQPLNSPGGPYRQFYGKETEFAHITIGTGNEINDLVRLAVDAWGYVINVTYPSAIAGRNLMTALVVFCTCGNMSIGDAVVERATPPPPAKPPEETEKPSIVPTPGPERPVIVPPEETEKPSIVPTPGPERPVIVPPEETEKPSIVPTPGPERPVIVPPEETEKPSIVPVPGPERKVEVPVSCPVPAAPLLSLGCSRSGAWAQNAPDDVASWQRGSIGAGVTWPVGRQPMTNTPVQPGPKPGGPPPNNLPQPTPTPTPNPVGSAPANPGGITDNGDGANGTTDVPPPTPIGAPNGGGKPVPANGSAAGPPTNTTLRSYPSQRR